MNHPKIDIYQEMDDRNYSSAKRQALWEMHFQLGLRVMDLRDVEISHYVDCIEDSPLYSIRVVRNNLQQLAEMFDE